MLRYCATKHGGSWPSSARNTFIGQPDALKIAERFALSLPCRLNLDEPRWRRKYGDKFIKLVSVFGVRLQFSRVVRCAVNFLSARDASLRRGQMPRPGYVRGVFVAPGATRAGSQRDLPPRAFGRRKSSSRRAVLSSPIPALVSRSPSRACLHRD